MGRRRGGNYLHLSVGRHQPLPGCGGGCVKPVLILALLVALLVVVL